MKIFKKLLSLVNSLFQKKEERDDSYTITITTNTQTIQAINRLLEMSGLPDRASLFSASCTVLDLLVEHELRGGEIYLDSDRFHLLELLNPDLASEEAD